MLAAVPRPCGAARCSAERPGGPARRKALPDQSDHSRPRLVGQELQAARGPPASEECGYQEAGSRRRCRRTKQKHLRTRKALPGKKFSPLKILNLHIVAVSHPEQRVGEWKRNNFLLTAEAV